MSGSWFKSEDKVELGMSENETCDLCGEKQEDITHILWECKKIHTGESCQKFEKLSREDIPRSMKLRNEMSLHQIHAT